MLHLLEELESILITASIPKKYEHIDFTPPKGVREAAESGLKLRKKYKRGGTPVGVARARDLANNERLSPRTMKRMKAFFDRHQAFKEHHKDKTSAAWISWQLWGGHAGYSWAKKVVRQMEAADKKE